MFDDRLALSAVVSAMAIWSWYETRKDRKVEPPEIDIPLHTKDGHVHIGSIDIPLPPLDPSFASLSTLPDADSP